jgi:hypothetical protein
MQHSGPLEGKTRPGKWQVENIPGLGPLKPLPLDRAQDPREVGEHGRPRAAGEIGVWEKKPARIGGKGGPQWRATRVASKGRMPVGWMLGGFL